MVKWYLGKRKWHLVISAVAVIAIAVVVLAFVGNQELVGEHMYPQDAIYDDSNVSVRGIVASIEENHRSDGFGFDCYHVFRSYIGLNITEVVWVGEDLAGFSFFSAGSSNIIGIGYDNLDGLHLSIGQVVECRGFYLPMLDSPYSSKIIVAPSISESYLEPE